MTLLAVDPALSGHSGVALFTDSGNLISAGRVPGSSITENHTVDRCNFVALKIWNWCNSTIPTQVVIEWPQIYKATKSKGDPNDLIALASVGSMVVAFAQAHLWDTWSKDVISKSPTVKQWSGGIPKEIKGKLPKDAWSSPRGKRIASVLTAAERALIPNSHDAIDAVGIGLWALGRLVPVRVYPGT